MDFRKWKIFAGKSNEDYQNAFQLPIVLLVFLLYGALSSFYKIETSQQGVVTRFGRFLKITDEGPHFKLPFGIDDVFKVEVTRIHELQFGFRRNGRLNNDQSEQESLMLTGDLNVAVVQWILQFKVEDPRKFLFNAQNVKKNIRDASVSVMRQVVGDKLVHNVLTTHRVSIAQSAHKLTQELLDQYDMGIRVTRVSLQSVTPPEKVKPAFNDINIAKQQREEMANKAKSKYNSIIPEAKGKAEREISNAQAFAINTINKAEGDSERFLAVYNSYIKSPKVMRQRLYLEAMEEVYSKAEQITIIDAKVQGLLPVFNETIRQGNIAEKITKK